MPESPSCLWQGFANIVESEESSSSQLFPEEQNVWTTYTGPQHLQLPPEIQDLKSPSCERPNRARVHDPRRTAANKNQFLNAQMSILHELQPCFQPLPPLAHTPPDSTQKEQTKVLIFRFVAGSLKELMALLLLSLPGCLQQ